MPAKRARRAAVPQPRPIPALDELIKVLKRPLTAVETEFFDALKVVSGDMPITFARKNVSEILHEYHQKAANGAALEGDFDDNIGRLLALPVGVLSGADLKDLKSFAEGTMTIETVQANIAAKDAANAADASDHEASDEDEDENEVEREVMLVRRKRSDISQVERADITFQGDPSHDGCRLDIDGVVLDVSLPSALIKAGTNPIREQFVGGIQKMKAGMVVQGAFEASHAFVNATLKSVAVGNVNGRQLAKVTKELGLSDVQFQYTPMSLNPFPGPPPAMGTAQFYWQTVDNGPTQLDQLHMLTPEELKNADTFKNLVNVDRVNN